MLRGEKWIGLSWSHWEPLRVRSVQDKKKWGAWAVLPGVGLTVTPDHVPTALPSRALTGLFGSSAGGNRTTAQG